MRRFRVIRDPVEQRASSLSAFDPKATDYRLRIACRDGPMKRHHARSSSHIDNRVICSESCRREVPSPAFLAVAFMLSAVFRLDQMYCIHIAFVRDDLWARRRRSLK